MALVSCKPIVECGPLGQKPGWLCSLTPRLAQSPSMKLREVGSLRNQGGGLKQLESFRGPHPAWGWEAGVSRQSWGTDRRRRLGLIRPPASLGVWSGSGDVFPSQEQVSHLASGHPLCARH